MVYTAVDMYGHSVKKKARELSLKKYYDFSGTDIHRADVMQFFLRMNIHKNIFKMNEI